VVAPASGLSQSLTGTGMAIEVVEVSHAFELNGSALPVLSHISFEAGLGNSVAFLGPSGCGKSTLLRLLAGLDKPTQGVLLANGRPILGPDPRRGLVFQDPTLFPWRTVRQNAALGPEALGRLHEQREKVDDALRLVGLSEFADAYPHQLSGGMAQRAALARVLVNDPKLLLLDEPFGRLDSLTRMVMQDELIALWQRARFTALLVTHDVEEALLIAERVVILTGRPARIKTVLVNELPYPRHRGDPHIQQLRYEALSHLGFVAK
jgi:NitT/TauT family transport system ATP-binding protein